METFDDIQGGYSRHSASKKRGKHHNAGHSGHGGANHSEPGKKKVDYDLKQAVQVHYKKLLELKEEDENIVIPPKFHYFVNSNAYYELLKSVLLYCQELFKLESKQEGLEEEAKQRGVPVPAILEGEKKRLADRAKDMATKYSWIVVQEKTMGNQQQDQNFFETVIYFTAKVLQEAFDKSDQGKLQDELNRLFRSNAFNITLRRQREENRYNRFPVLREPSRPENVEATLTRVERRIRVPKDAKSKSTQEGRSLRPGYNRMSAHAAISARSPLISMLFPSPKDKIREFEQRRRRMISQRQRQAVSVDKRKVQNALENELRKRGGDRATSVISRSFLKQPTNE
eukprot:CAMPEP_0115013612 /NCGR_PEP_ID=MMETSP0216-20121206/25524_1 /TAXON_ID=223996 /ORGANISM="Protocruzia adherens, Strain Boccale" /LENGTH=341 /DNA_ID=CAMNT_0002383069 /DNA_START=99 /DNA_END=1124 /DNA_ORIENTATION=-